MKKRRISRKSLSSMFTKLRSQSSVKGSKPTWPTAWQLPRPRLVMRNTASTNWLLLPPPRSGSSSVRICSLDLPVCSGLEPSSASLPMASRQLHTRSPQMITSILESSSLPSSPSQASSPIIRLIFHYIFHVNTRCRVFEIHTTPF